jgi:hypothetical protein
MERPGLSPPTLRRAGFVGMLALCAAWPANARAQAVTVRGRIYDARSGGAAIQNAVVLLEGTSGTLSDRSGGFTLRGVTPGPHALRVRALGYEDLVLALTVERDTTLSIGLTPAPIRLDSLGVTMRKIKLDGSVKDTLTNAAIADAEVSSDQGHLESTNLFGTFGLGKVFEGAPIRLTIRAFRYLQLDTTVVPKRGRRYPFDLVRDPLMSRMIDEYVERLDVRGGKRVTRYRPPVDRDELARMRPNTSLLEVLQRQFPAPIVRSIGCLFVDEFEYRFGKGDDGYRRSVYEGTFVNDVQRVELYEFPGEGRLIMVRVYTTRFFKQRVGGSKPLVTPSMIETPKGFFCR